MIGKISSGCLEGVSGALPTSSWACPLDLAHGTCPRRRGQGTRDLDLPLPGLPRCCPHALVIGDEFLGVDQGPEQVAEALGLVARRELPPPAARTVYDLTDAGRALLPVIGALAQWGLAHLPPPEPGEVVSPTLAVLAERFGLPLSAPSGPGGRGVSPRQGRREPPEKEHEA